jgi:hypothetical protein
MARRRKRQLDRSVTCRVTLIVGGRRVKTVRRRLSLAAAVREIGGDPLGTEGRLITGRTWPMRRRVTAAVAVVVEYLADPRPTEQLHASSFELNTADAAAVIRADLAG